MSGQRHPKRTLLGVLAELLRRTNSSLYQPRLGPTTGELNAQVQLAPPANQQPLAKIIPFPSRNEKLIVHPMPVALPRRVVFLKPRVANDVPGPVNSSQAQAGIR